MTRRKFWTTRSTRDGEQSVSSPRILLGDVSNVPATSRTRSDPGKEQAGIRRDNFLSQPPSQDVQATMGTTDQVVDTTNDLDDGLISIEPVPAPDIRTGAFAQSSRVDIDRTLHLAESPDRHTSSNLHEDDALPPLHRPGEVHNASLQSWESLKDPQAQVEGGRIRLKKMKILLRLSHKSLDTEQASLLARLKALGSDFSASKFRALILDFEAHGAASQRLQRAELEYDKAEEQLNADEWYLRELESTVYGDPLSPIELDFPAGWLDFTGDEPRRAMSNATSASVPAESLPEKIEYDRCLEDADAWREKLLNLESEHAQLDRQRAKRARLGLALDSFSTERLEKYDAEHEHLTSGLDQAETTLELAEVVWTRRKSTLEQISQMTDQVIGLSLYPPHAKLSTTAENAPGQEDHFYELADTSAASADHQSDLALNIARILQQAEPEPVPVFRVPSLHSNGHNVNMATFINQWLLQRVRQCPEETVRLANKLASTNPGCTAENIVEASISHWLSDGSEKEFFIAVEAGDHSFHESLAPNNGLVEILNDRATSQRLRLNSAVRTGGRVANTDR